RHRALRYLPPFPTRRSSVLALSEQLQAEIRASRYRSIRQLAEAMGEDYTTLYRWVSNKRPIRMDTLFRILAMLELDPGEFFTDVDRKSTRLNSSHVRISYAV